MTNSAERTVYAVNYHTYPLMLGTIAGHASAVYDFSRPVAISSSATVSNKRVTSNIESVESNEKS